MARNDGHIPISRSFFEHELWDERREFSKAEAWLWIIYQARYKPTENKRIIAKRLVRWEQGQIPGSLEFLRRAWNWGSTKKVRNFLNYLEAEDMITCDTTQGVTVLHLSNYLKHNPHLSENPVQTHGSASPQGSAAHPSPHSVPPSSVSGPDTVSSPPSPAPIDDKSSVTDITAHLVTYWNQCNDTRLTTKAKGRSAQVRARLKTFPIEDIKKAIYIRATTPWTKANDQQANWDAVMSSDKKLDHWLNRNPERNESKKTPKHPKQLGYLTRDAALKLAQDKRKEFNASNFDKMEHQTQTWYKPLFQ